jgi:hypothetical protein
MSYNTFTNEVANANEVGAVGANEVGANAVGANEVGANEVGANGVGANANAVGAVGANAIYIDTDKQCIICLEKTPINGKDHITLMNEMHFLIKKCECLCNAHHTCLEKWIGTNPVCPICKGEISFPLMAMNNKHVIIDLQGMQSNGMQMQMQNNGMQSTHVVTSHLCIRITILIFFVLTVLQIVFRN